MGSGLLKRSFFERPSWEVAPDLLGRVLVHGPVSVRLTEVEAYGLPGEDPASHTFRGQTPRNTVMFGPPGHLYVYFTYGMHFCANLSCLPEGQGCGVLMRAGEIVQGIKVARERRAGASDRDLARGPARLAVALGLDRAHNGLDCIAGDEVTLLEGVPAASDQIRTGPRTGVSSAMDAPWRFWIDGERSVSPYKRHVPKVRTRGA